MKKAVAFIPHIFGYVPGNTTETRFAEPLIGAESNEPFKNGKLPGENAVRPTVIPRSLLASRWRDWVSGRYQWHMFSDFPLPLVRSFEFSLFSYVVVVIVVRRLSRARIPQHRYR